MPIWKTTPISKTPEINLISWRIFEVSSEQWPKVTRHFVGYNSTDQEGRVSSAILVFDPAEARGVTNSGRVYQLWGRPGFNSDAEYVWNKWRDINGITHVTNITNDVGWPFGQPFAWPTEEISK